MNTAGQGCRKTHYNRAGAEDIERGRLNIKKIK